MNSFTDDMGKKGHNYEKKIPIECDSLSPLSKKLIQTLVRRWRSVTDAAVRLVTNK
jgi:hypothetical protein